MSEIYLRPLQGGANKCFECLLSVTLVLNTFVHFFWFQCVCIWLALSCCCLFCILSSLFFNLCLCSSWLLMDRQKERRGGNERKHLQSTLDLVWKSDFISKTAFDLSIRPRERGHETIALWILPRSGFEHLILKAGKAPGYPMIIGGGAVLWERAEVWSMSREHS